MDDERPTRVVTNVRGDVKAWSESDEFAAATCPLCHSWLHTETIGPGEHIDAEHLLATHHCDRHEQERP